MHAEITFGALECGSAGTVCMKMMRLHNTHDNKRSNAAAAAGTVATAV
jgi:hypothetical protein